MGDKRGDLGDESPQRGPGAEPQWWSGEPETNANFQLRREDMHSCTPGYAADYGYHMIELTSIWPLN